LHQSKKNRFAREILAKLAIRCGKFRAGALLQPSAIFARLNCWCKWVQSAKKRLEFALALWDDDSMMFLSSDFQAGRDC
jgi:hypothetical protein